MPLCLYPPIGVNDVAADGVDLHGPGADPLRDRQPEREVVGVHTARQAVLAVVGDGDGFVDVGVALHRDDRPEDFTLRERVRVVVDVDDGWCVVPAPLETLGPAAAGDQTPARGEPFGDEAFDPPTVRLGDERSDHRRRLVRVGRWHALGGGADRVEHLRLLVVRHEHPRLQRAALARVRGEHHRRLPRRAGRPVGERVGQVQLHALAPELEDHAASASVPPAPRCCARP